MSSDSNKNVSLPPGPVKDKSGLAQPSTTAQRAWPTAEDWLRHYEWEGTNPLGMVCPASELPPTAPPIGQAIIDEQRY